MMEKLWLIIKREYLIRVKKKTFIIATLLTPIAFGLFMFGAGYLAKRSSESHKVILLKDESKVISQDINDVEFLQFEFSEQPLDSLKNNLENSKYDLMVHIPPINPLDKMEIDAYYYVNEKPGLATLDRIEARLASQFRDYKIEHSQVDQALLESFDIEVNLDSPSTDSSESSTDGEAKESSNGKLSIIVGTILGTVMGFMMYMVIFIFGNMVMRSVMEEKINRIVEVMISTVKPFQLMLGKVLGVGGVGLTQLLIWIILLPIIAAGVSVFMGEPVLASDGMNGAMEQAKQASDDFSVSQIISEFMSMNWGLILPFFVVFFLGGYLLYSSLFAAVGSAIGDDMGESQSLMMPIILLVVFALLIMVNSLDNPNNSLAVFGSIFPLFSPIVMPMRLAFNPPIWQVVLSAILLLLTSVFFIWLSSKIYRVGILMYGKKMSLKEIAKWTFRKN